MDIVKVCYDFGVTAAEEVAVDKITLDSSLREYCEQNRCGRYGKNYTCPPMIGEADALIRRIRSFQTAVIWQNVYPLEDSFDFEGMMTAQVKHNEMTLAIMREVSLYNDLSDILFLAAGGCSICPVCASETTEPCRNPEIALSSLEAYGINVSKIEEVTGMKYINGANTVTYFAGVFIKDR